MPRLLRTLNAWADLARPLNAGLAVVGVVLGGYLAAGVDAFAGANAQALALAALAATLVGAGANALNDRLDVATDRVNRPNRPIPSGRATERQATTLWLALSAVAVGVAAQVSTWHATVAAGSVVVLAVYSRWLKGTPLVGNAVVAAVVAFALLFGGEAVGGGVLAVLGAAFAFAVNLVRELVKDVEDVDGDRVAGLNTAAVRWGVPAAMRLALAALVAVLVSLPLPVVFGRMEPSYLLAAVGAGAALMAAGANLLPVSQPTHPGRASAWLKGAMVLGMVALAMGR
ncbi:MAG: geranylgeranylglycerol-phosphate geranylgeranyltransferase [Rhodothermales bacterium]|nr:geranylgeranylglycerol-phosphate geranylgeranyltransferase [Rhodothermales bacterium]